MSEQPKIDAYTSALSGEGATASEDAVAPLLAIMEHMAKPMPTIACPHCGGEFAIQPVARFQKQELTFAIKYEGDSISATTVAGAISNMDKLLRSIAKDIGVKAHVFMPRIEQRDHEMVFTFMVAEAKPGAKK
jgi:hypothetical protein